MYTYNYITTWYNFHIRNKLMLYYSIIIIIVTSCHPRIMMFISSLFRISWYHHRSPWLEYHIIIVYWLFQFSLNHQSWLCLISFQHNQNHRGRLRPVRITINRPCLQRTACVVLVPRLNINKICIIPTGFRGLAYDQAC